MSDFWRQQRTLHTELSHKKPVHDPTSYMVYKELAQEAYKKKPSQTVMKDWNLILNTNNNKVYQNRMTGEVVNAVSGSKSLKDFANDGLQYLGWSNNPLQRKRYGETDDILKRLSAIERKRDVNLTSHSLGSNVSNRLVQEGKSSKSVNFNAFIPDKALNIDDDRVINIRNKNDFASKLTKDNNNTVNLDNPSNSIKSHFMSELKL
jgi:hypothetical protein